MDPHRRTTAMPTKVLPPAEPLPFGKDLPAMPLSASPPWTTEERLLRIQTMGRQILGYIEYMCQVGSLSGTSAEAKERAVTAFYERMVVVERQLGRIQEDLRLG
jgi:hypothetical protein